jgi:hypothetical protein
LTCDFAGEFGFYFEVGFARGQNDKQEQEQRQATAKAKANTGILRFAQNDDIFILSFFT